VKSRDKNTNTESTTGPKLYSLRQRYLIVTSTVMLTLFGFAWLAQSYLGNYSRHHRTSTEMRAETTHNVYQMRNHAQQLEYKLNNYLWSPTRDKNQALHQEIENTLTAFNQLKAQPWLNQLTHKGKSGNLVFDIQAQHATLSRIFAEIGTESSSLPTTDSALLNQRLQPLLQLLWEYLHRLENELRLHANSDAEELSHVAATTTHNLSQ
jgi:hypothetical protein